MLRRIAVHLDSDEDCARRIDIAAALARRHQARLVGIYASFRHPQDAYEGTMVTAAINAIDVNSGLVEQQKLMTQLHEAAKRAGVVSQFRTDEALPEDILAYESRFCDVLVISQPANYEFEPLLLPGFLASVILTAGRPVLMLPAMGNAKPIGKRVLYCWDGGRESARAIADAAPFLHEAKELFVLVIDPHKKPQRYTAQHRADLSDYCLQHQYPLPQSIERFSAGTTVGECILSAAADTGSDLLVMGAYGHSRLRQAILGGTTRTLVESMTLPVMFSH